MLIAHLTARANSNKAPTTICKFAYVINKYFIISFLAILIVGNSETENPRVSGSNPLLASIFQRLTPHQYLFYTLLKCRLAV